MRGKAYVLREDLPHVGITPAYAGKSEKARNCVIFTGDHPRLCGEKWYNNRRGELYVGSPPPMRGKVGVPAPAAVFAGITPAYAGKRQAVYHRCRTAKDHPRLCGEK